MDIVAIGIGAVSGGALAFFGYLKSFKTNSEDEPTWEHESFKPWKALSTIVLGAIVGGGVAYSGLTADGIQLFLASTGITLFIEDTAKAIWRKL